nr:UDP-N-acetylmuramoyl-tripeptide--D-alanyl-D-alanine ligase [Tissierella sp.]
MEYLHYIVSALIILIVMVLLAKRSKLSLHLLQLEDYNKDRYKLILNINRKLIFSLNLMDLSAAKPLVFTKRATRLYSVNLAISIIILLASAIPVIMTGKLLYVIFLLLTSFILFRQQPYMVLITNIIMLPFEKKINDEFFTEAQKKIKSFENLKTIGITGSFGKSSTKLIVGTILASKYKVLNPPEIYNTTVGLSKAINEELDETIEVFVTEMRGRQIGEIQELAKLCQPQIGIITSIGPAHMQVFKNIDNIMKAMYELIEELPADGVAIFNYDNEHIKKLADKTFKEKMLYGLEDIEKLDIYADDIVVSELGSTFTIKDKEGNSHKCATKLIGKENISNILAGVCASRTLGLTLEEIVKAIGTVKPIPHRLNIINREDGIIVIDDSLNLNPIGVKGALEALSQFKEGKKIIVTPGMSELGEIEETANREFGISIGKVCDYAILVGEEATKTVYKGLIEGNFNPDSIFTVDSLDKAALKIKEIARPKDIVLFENDIPVSYK